MPMLIEQTFNSLRSRVEDAYGAVKVFTLVADAAASSIGFSILLILKHFLSTCHSHSMVAGGFEETS